MPHRHRSKLFSANSVAIRIDPISFPKRTRGFGMFESESQNQALVKIALGGWLKSRHQIMMLPQSIE